MPTTRPVLFSTRPWLTPMLVVVMLVAMALEIAAAVHGESPTWDEGDHLFSGFMSLRTGDFGLNPEHPPMAKMVGALPLVGLDLKLPKLQNRFFKAEAYDDGRKFLFGNAPSQSMTEPLRMSMPAGERYTAQQLIFRARLAMLVHMMQVFLFGAYKFPRELTWIFGVGLLLLTLAMAFTGQVMRFDQDAYWGLGIGAMIVSRVPFVGASLVHLVLGGPIIGAPTLSRFFALHVFVIPGLLLAATGVHVWMTLYHGVSEWPMPGRLVRKSTYQREYKELTAKTGIPFVPDAAWKDAVFAAAIILAVMACAFFFGPTGPNGPPDPTIIQTAPKPDFAFLWIYSVLAFLPPSIETPVILVAPVLGIAAMLLLPLFANQGERHWSRRPVAVLIVAVIAVTLGVFTRLGTYTPWSPIMNAWTSDAVPINYLRDRTPLERQGALVLQDKQCRNCHSLDGVGGLRGPALDAIATRMTEDQIIRQVLQGGGNMPAYGNALNPSETKALVSFLTTLRGHNLAPAIDAAQGFTHTTELQVPVQPASAPVKTP